MQHFDTHKTDSSAT